MSRAAIAVIAVLAAVGCSNPSPGQGQASAARSGSLIASLTPPAWPTAPATSRSFCPGLLPGHPLLLEELGAPPFGNDVVVRDVANPYRGVTLCSFSLAGQAGFVSDTRVAIWDCCVNARVSVFDLLGGSSKEVFSYDHNTGPVLSIDWDSTGQVFGYGRLTPDGKSVVFHVVAAGVDRVLATVYSPGGLGIGDARIEFSPDGDYVALGARGALASGDGASVQVRRRDGTLVFSSGGTAQLTWAGTPSKLYFQGPSRVETWDDAHGAGSTSQQAWRLPISSPGRRWLAFEVPGGSYPGELRLMDTTNGSVRSLGNAQSPAWVTSTLLRYTQFVSCGPSTGGEGPPPCVTRPVIFDTSDGTTTVTVQAYVFGTWPRGSPIWGVS